MEGLVTLLRSPSCFTLKELRLNNTGCGVTGGKLLAQTLLECYRASAAVGHPLALKVFVLGRSRQENEGAKALGRFLKVSVFVVIITVFRIRTLKIWMRIHPFFCFNLI